MEKKPQKGKVQDGLVADGARHYGPASIPVLYEVDLEEHLRSRSIRARMERVHRLVSEQGKGDAPRPC
jgi:hypothetical protein